MTVNWWAFSGGAFHFDVASGFFQEVVGHIHAESGSFFVCSTFSTFVPVRVNRLSTISLFIPIPESSTMRMISSPCFCVITETNPSGFVNFMALLRRLLMIDLIMFSSVKM